MKRVLLISYAFPPLSIAGTFRPMRFVKYLCRYGWEPSVITVEGREDIFRDHALLKEIPQSLEIFHIRALGPKSLRFYVRRDGTQGSFPSSDPRWLPSIIRKFFRKVDITNIANFLNDLISIPDPLIYWIPPVILRAIKNYKQRPYHAIITTSPPHSSHFAGFVLSKMFKIPWIADFRDPWVDNIYFTELKGKIRQTIEIWMERVIMHHADGIIANTQPNRNLLLKRYASINGAVEKFTTITNGFDREFIDAITAKTYDKFTICHTGRFYSVLDPYFFFEAFAKWLEGHKDDHTRENVQVLIIGSEDSKLRESVDQLKLTDCVQFVPRVSHHEAIAYAKAAHLLLVNLGFKSRALGWIPLKLYDYLGCGRPILGILPRDGAAADLIKQSKIGEVISQPDYDAVGKILGELYTQCQEEGKVSYAIDRDVFDQFEMKTLTKRLVEVLNSLDD